MKDPFSVKVKTTRIVRIDPNGVLTHGDPDPTSLQVGVVDDRGRLQVLIFEGETVAHLGNLVRLLIKAIPNAFEAEGLQRSGRD